MFDNVDLLIVGAGPVGCVVAEQAATQLGWRCLIVEKRNHIAGNCYDRLHESGLLIHEYGPHYFRTDSSELISYLDQFTQWIPGNYIVKSYLKEQLFTFPINLDTLEQFFNIKLTTETAMELLEEKRVKIDNPENSEELVISKVGKELYEAFYLGYTLKQWERHPSELDVSVCGRIPVRFNRDQRYVDHRFQVMPAQGYTVMFSNMIRHPLIRIITETDYREVRNLISPFKATVYCGPVDEYFDYSLGKLPWRSLDFEFREFDVEYRQPCAVINYPNNFEYIRTFESKHITGQKHPKTVVSYEYPKSSGDPYYPVPGVESQSLYKHYHELAEEETKKSMVLFAGRLANYQYLNMDEAIDKGLSIAEQLKILACA